MAARGAVEIILDASGSMLKRMDGQRRIENVELTPGGEIEVKLD